MVMAQECEIERQQDGTRICKLHQVPLVPQTIQPIESNPFGHPDPVTGAWHCPRSSKDTRRDKPLEIVHLLWLCKQWQNCGSFPEIFVLRHICTANNVVPCSTRTPDFASRAATRNHQFRPHSFRRRTHPKSHGRIPRPENDHSPRFFG